MFTFPLKLLILGWVCRAEKFDDLREKISQAISDYKPCQVSNNSGCSLCHYAQITRDLAPWSEGISQNDVKRASKYGVLYQIIDGEVYRQSECLFPFRCSGIEYFLLKLAKRIPNIEFVINVRDYPQSFRGREKLPVFSFSKVPKSNFDITYPAWTFWEGGPAISLYPTGIGRWDLLSESIVSASDRFTWDTKEDKAFFRGSRTSSERDPLIRLSRRNPEFVDAQYTKNQAWKSDKDTLGMPAASEVTFEDHCRYKYLFNFRGVAASFRFKHLFLCKSLVFHVSPEKSTEDWIEFFYPALKPWVHYIPMTPKQLENAEYLLTFAKENQEVAQQIAQRGYEAIKENLRMKDVMCYWKRLLNKYSKLLTFEVVKDKSLIHIEPRAVRKTEL